MAKAKPRVDARYLPGPQSGGAAPRWTRWFAWSVLACAVLLGLWAFGLTVGRSGDAGRFASGGWGQYADVIVANKIRALWHGAFMTLCAAGFLLVQLRAPSVRWRSVAVWTAVLLVAFDAWLLSRHYVQTMPLSALGENPVIAILKKDMPERRVALVSQDGFYNWWLTYLFPYHGIRAVNITQMPRMATDYKNFLGAVGRDPVRYWQLAAVGYVLAPAPVWAQIQKDRAMQDAFELVYSYNVVPAEAGVTVVPPSPAQPGQHVVLRLKKPAPRFALLAGWERASDEDALRLLGSSTHALFERALVAPEFAGGLPPLDGRGMAAGTVKLNQYRSGRMELTTESGQANVLRVSEKYDGDWTAAVDGKPAAVLRVDYIFQGLLVPAGRHEVVLQYAPPLWPLASQAAGLLICLGAIGSLIGSRFRRSASNGGTTSTDTSPA